jgi:hypothetical protein
MAEHHPSWASATPLDLDTILHLDTPSAHSFLSFSALFSRRPTAYRLLCSRPRRSISPSSPADPCSFQGFFMEPHPTSNILKLCNEFSGFTHLTPARPFGSNPSSSPLISVPRSHADHPTDTIPTSSLSDIRALIRTCLPHLRDRPIINQAMCWCTDMPDARWLLCEHPRWGNLVLATGDSGHTFKMLPVVGREVVDLIEGKVGVGSGFGPDPLPALLPETLARSVSMSTIGHRKAACSSCLALLPSRRVPWTRSSPHVPHRHMFSSRVLTSTRRPVLTLRAPLTSLPPQLPEARRELWKWRPGRGDPEHTGRGGPPPKDIADLPGWRHDDEEPSSKETETVSGVVSTEAA